MESWQTKVEMTVEAVKLLVTKGADDVLKARLPGPCGHPRALLTLLEGLALWCGKPLTAVIAVDVSSTHLPGLGRCEEFEGGLWPEESALVHFLFAEPAGRGRHISGLGSFIRLRRLTGRR